MEEESLVLKYVQINSVPNGSTGSVMQGIHEELVAHGHESYMEWGRRRSSKLPYEHNFGTSFEINPLDVVATALDGKAGFHSARATKRLIRRLDEINPDVVHLHNLHGYYLNIEMLFEWLAHHRCLVKWTLHDCWAFTGHCAHFTYAKCDQWRFGCAYEKACPQIASYPMTLSRRSCKWNYEQKKRIFNSIEPERMEIITPSKWLAGLVESSFLSDYKITVRHNEVDSDVFRPLNSNFKSVKGIDEDKIMVLGVASPWTARKGLADFGKLSRVLDLSKYEIVLIGLSKKQIEEIDNRILAFPRTESKEELAEAYAAADVFFNPTLEDNYPTVNLEAEACGTPVITYDTGGCRETIRRSDSSVVSGFDEALSALNKLSSGSKEL